MQERSCDSSKSESGKKQSYYEIESDNVLLCMAIMRIYVDIHEEKKKSCD